MLALTARIAALQAKFLAKHITAELAAPLTYVADTDDLAAFRLLAHAEIEEYLETKAREGLATIENGFTAGRSTVRDNINLLVIAHLLKTELRFDPAKWKADCQFAVTTAREWVSKNNGIKEASFTMLSIFAGKMPDEVDSGLAASLSTYGASRGDVAHRSVTRVRTINAPSAEAKSVNDLVAALDRYFV